MSSIIYKVSFVYNIVASLVSIVLNILLLNTCKGIASYIPGLLSTSLWFNCVYAIALAAFICDRRNAFRAIRFTTIFLYNLGYLLCSIPDLILMTRSYGGSKGLSDVDAPDEFVESIHKVSVCFYVLIAGSSMILISLLAHEYCCRKREELVAPLLQPVGEEAA